MQSQLPFSDNVKVRFRDLDAQGHLYFANYLVYGDEVLGAYMEELFHIGTKNLIPID